MARVQLIIPDEDRDRFVHQARKEGLTFSAWLRAAAHERLEDRQRSNPFESPADVEEFFRACDALEGPEREPDWEEHLRTIDESRGRMAANS
ncbi:MAG: hypothetical protein OXG46_09360 [Chloroflexi bacterium]|nr:hypothetical protein [Chloroflexota bacterium]MCY3939393.1 hypothetical protein [Chloroflexota bacterium]